MLLWTQIKRTINLLSSHRLFDSAKIARLRNCNLTVGDNQVEAITLRQPPVTLQSLAQTATMPPMPSSGCALCKAAAGGTARSRPAAGPGGKAQPFPLRSSFPSAEEAALLGALSAQDPLCTLLPSHSGHTAGPKLRACNMPFTSDIICGKFNFLQEHDRNKITLLFVALGLGWILSSICFLCIRSLLNWCQ